jgi:VWFA-related protein
MAPGPLAVGAARRRPFLLAVIGAGVYDRAMLASASPFLLTLALAGPATPGARAQAPDEPPTVAVTAAEVAVDLVVRDKQGRLVLDLEPGDVEVYEDGVRQDVETFRLITTTATTADAGGTLAPPDAGAEAAPAPPPPDDEHALAVALVFDRLGPEARRNAFDAATEWVKLPAVTGRHVGVFRIDQGLEMLQDFTDDRATVHEALDDVLMALPTRYTSGRDRSQLRRLRNELSLLQGRTVGQALQGSLSADEPGDALAFQGAGPGMGSVERQTEYHLRAVELAMLQAMESLERDQQGLATANSLLALVNGLRELPGRKAVVFFSEGLVLPERVLGTLKSVISEANRAGVSFYAADAAGLRIRSGADETRRELSGMADMMSSAASNDAVSGDKTPMTRMMERTEDILRLDPATGLGTLARDTGGFLIADTNAIAAGLRRVEEELGAYYLLSYAPNNESWDGSYRRIEIKARRSGLRVQGRQGYFAVKVSTPTPILEHEAPVLAGLERAPTAAEISLRARALQFPGEYGESVVALVADLPALGPSVHPSEDDEGTYTQDFTVLALVRDEAGRIVHKASRRYVLSWSEANLEDLEVGRVLFARETLLPPGRYTVEIVARDAQEGRMGVTRVPLELPAASDAELRLSSLMVVGHAEPHALGQPSPLLYEGVQLYPNLGDPVSLAAGKPLAFLFSLRPGARPLASATVELFQGDTSVLQSPVALPSPDPSGQMRVVSGLQVGSLEPGDYVLRLSVNNAQGFQSRSTPFQLAP